MARPTLRSAPVTMITLSESRPLTFSPIVTLRQKLLFAGVLIAYLLSGARER